MNDSIIKHKTILGIDSNMGFLEDLKKTILNECPECRFDKAASFNQGRQYMATFSYDLVPAIEHVLKLESAPGLRGVFGLALSLTNSC